MIGDLYDNIEYLADGTLVKVVHHTHEPWLRIFPFEGFEVDGLRYQREGGSVYLRPMIELCREHPHDGSASYMQCSQPPTAAEVDAWIHDPDCPDRVHPLKNKEP